ncbi:T9SS type A sorting domain-containing protein [Lunatibacter salilacus]|uniref:T9SS type A sorting domain-containing protein n=1 Tax=Lunatibacter salilacus TaxID=2483804 RepID=UPI00131D8FAE|nr:T9SS type A sorting domain-containing protein [Lunatibacter salilacus]
MGIVDRKLCLIALGSSVLMLCSTPLWAQFKQLPVVHSENPTSDQPQARLLEEPLALPFWDDFSSGNISSELWVSRGVQPSMTLGIDPPTIGVCFLDGVDSRGNPYERDRLINGEGDQLISKPIDLSTTTSAEENSVFLSFFWQPGGKGEMPDVTDQLELHILNNDGQWVKIWEVLGGDESLRQQFTQELIRITPEYFHEKFQFKFQYVGRLSGPFDTWILDYVYLNKGRNASDYFYEDRALTKVPNSPFGTYTAIPLYMLQGQGNDFLSEIVGQFNNLSNRFRAMEFTLELRNRETGRLIKSINANTPINPVPQAQERRDFATRLSEPIVWTEEEPFDLETRLYLSTGDEFKVRQGVGRDTVFEPSIDFRVNDTVKFMLPVRDFLAYDNGSADYSAGINQRSGMLALKYEVEGDAFISGVSINFTNYLQRGNAVELMVWDSLGMQPIYKEEVLIPELEDLNDFAYFPIDTTIRVSGNFYVGFTQFTNDFVYVGLDKTTDTGEEVYFNVYGTWEQNTTVVGSLMIRPHLSLTPPFIPEETTEEEVRVYPNPVLNRLTVEGNVDEIRVFDFQGRQINVPIDSEENGKVLTFVNQHKGIYLIRYRHQNKMKSIRILVK